MRVSTKIVEHIDGLEFTKSADAIKSLTLLQSHLYPVVDVASKEHNPLLLQTPGLLHKPPSQSFPRKVAAQSQLIPDATAGLSLLYWTYFVIYL